MRLVTEEEWRKVDKRSREVLREPLTFTNIPKLPVPKGQKEHKYLENKDMPNVNEGTDFWYDAREYPDRKPNTAKLTYLTFPVQIKRSDIDASSSYGIQSLLETAEIEGRAEIMKHIEHVVYHGSDDGRAEGLANYTNRLQYGSDAAKDLTTVHNFKTQLEGALSTIREQHVLPPYTLIWTPGIAAELRASNISGLQNEYTHFKECYLDGNVIDKVIETDAIVDATLSTSNQSFIVAKLGVENGYVAETYPLHRDNIKKEFESDVAYALKWAGGYVPKNASGACVVTGLSTSNAY